MKPYGNPVPITALPDFLGTHQPWHHVARLRDGNLASCNGRLAVLWTKLDPEPRPPLPPPEFLLRWERIPFHLHADALDESFASLDEAQALRRPRPPGSLFIVGNGALARVEDLHLLARLPRAEIQVTAMRGQPILARFNGGRAVIGAIRSTDPSPRIVATIFTPRRFSSL